jgi:hypothetical protein
MKSRKHTIAVTVTFTRKLSPKKARNLLEKALDDIQELGKAGRSYVVKTIVKDINKVSTAMEIKKRKKRQNGVQAVC